MRPKPLLFVNKQRGDYPDRDIPDLDQYGHRKVVCRRCHIVMRDLEPATQGGEFYHHAMPHQKRALACPNDRHTFYQTSKEVEPFMRKGWRRALKRMGVRA